MGTTSLSTAMVRTIKRGSTIGYYRSVTNRISSFTIEKILFWVDTWYRTALCLRGCDQLCSRKLRWVHRKIYSTGCKRYPLSRIQPLSHRWFLIKDIKALVCPFAVLRSRFGLRYSRVRGRRQSKFLASSSTGGARNFYPYTVGFRAPPVADTARKASRCRPQVRERIAEARAANGEGAEIRTPLPQAALRRSYARRRRAALIRHGAGCAAPRHLPQGEGYVLRTEHRVHNSAYRSYARRGSLRFAAGRHYTGKPIS